MVLADYNYPIASAIWTVFIFFGWIAWFYLLYLVFRDLFVRDDIGVWVKVAWIVACLCLPVIGAITYLIVYGSDMQDRRRYTGRVVQS